MEPDVAMEQPVPRAVGHPAHAHRRGWVEGLGDHESALGGSVECVRSTVAPGKDLVVEPVQVHWMGPGGGVDDSPAHRVSHRCGDALVVGPGAPVDRQGVPVVGRIERLAPDVDHQDAVRRGAVRWIHDEGAGHLLPLIVLVKVVPAGDGHVEIGARHCSGEAHLPRFPRPKHQAVLGRGRPGLEAANREGRIGQGVPHRGDDHRPGANPDQRAGNRRRPALFGERGDVDRGTAIRLGAPLRHPHHEPDREGVVDEPAGGDTVVIGPDPRKAGRRSMRPAGAQQNGNEQHRPQPADRVNHAGRAS